MIARRAAVAAFLALLLGGCGQAGPIATVSGTTRIVAGARVATGAQFRTQAVVSALTPASVDRMRFELWEVAGGQESWLATTETSTGSSTSQTVDWAHLRANWAYRIKACALDQSGQILNFGGAAAVRDVTTGAEDALQETIPIQLADRVFDGRVHPLVSAGPGDASKTDHIRFTLLEQVAGAWISRDTEATPAGSGLTRTVDFLHLKMATQYRLKVELIRANGKVQESKQVHFATTNDDDLTVSISF